jgi:hypothetical protein
MNTTTEITTEMTEQTESNQHKPDMNINRQDIKIKWGLPKVSDITNARRALGQPDWQNSKMSEADATELNQYFSLVLDKKISPEDAILQIASSRNGRAAYCNDIDPDAIAKASERLERVKSERFLIMLLVFTLSKLQEKRDFKQGLFDSFVGWLNTGGW